MRGTRNWRPDCRSPSPGSSRSRQVFSAVSSAVSRSARVKVPGALTASNTRPSVTASSSRASTSGSGRGPRRGRHRAQRLPQFGMDRGQRLPLDGREHGRGGGAGGEGDVHAALREPRLVERSRQQQFAQGRRQRRTRPAARVEAGGLRPQHPPLPRGAGPLPRGPALHLAPPPRPSTPRHRAVRRAIAWRSWRTGRCGRHRRRTSR